MSGSRDATAFRRSVVKVAMPQRRGREFPTKAMRWSWLTFGPPEAKRYGSCDIAENAATGGEATPAGWDSLPLTAAALPWRKSEIAFIGRRSVS